MTVQLADADPDMSHNWAVMNAQAPFPYMSMMTGPAFAGASSAPPGDPTSAGLPSETVSFTSSTAGTYTYLCQAACPLPSGCPASSKSSGPDRRRALPSGTPLACH